MTDADATWALSQNGTHHHVMRAIVIDPEAASQYPRLQQDRAMASPKDRKTFWLRSLIGISLLANIILVPLAGYWIYTRGGIRHTTLESLRGNMARSPSRVQRELFHLYDRMPHRPRPIVMFGDSLVGGGLWSEWFGSQVLNRGIGGETSAEALLRVSDVAALRPAKVFILLGNNDFGVLPDEQTAANLTNIVTQLNAASPSTEIYIASILPPPSLAREQWEITVNNHYQSLARRQHLHWVDLRPWFADGRVIDRTLTTDGVHLSPNGYEVWRHAMEPIMVPQDAAISQPTSGSN